MGVEQNISYDLDIFLENMLTRAYKFQNTFLYKILDIFWLNSAFMMTNAELRWRTAAKLVRSGGRAVERWTVNRGDGGSIQPTTISKLRQFRSPHIACVFRKRLKAGGPFYLVSMPGEVKDPTQMCSCIGLSNSREGQL